MFMDNKSKFNNILNDLIDYASVNSNKITKEEVANAFSDIIEGENMYKAIYDYLRAKKITVVGYESDANEINEFCSATEPDLSDIKIDEEAATFLNMYKNDLEAIIPITDSEKNILIEKLLSGDESAKDRLIEAHLHFVLDIASGYSGREVPVSDLIQEGNIGLMNAVASYDGNINFDKHIEKIIHEYINASLDTQISSDRIGEHIADRANQLDAVAKSLSEELDREPTVSELSERMSLSEDEIERILKFSLNALTVDGADGTPEDNNSSNL